MNLSDAFTRRKEIQEEIKLWTTRLSQSGTNSKVYNLDPNKKEISIISIIERQYTIEECIHALNKLMEEDKSLAVRISKTNSKIEVDLEDYEGNIRKVSIAELLILKDSIIPNMQIIVNSKPIITAGATKGEQKKGYIEYEILQPIAKNIDDVKEGVKFSKQIIESYTKSIIQDFGITLRQKYDEQDKINQFARRVKKALNEANKTTLLNL